MSSLISNLIVKKTLTKVYCCAISSTFKTAKMKKLLLYAALTPQTFNRVILPRGAQIGRIARHISTIT